MRQIRRGMLALLTFLFSLTMGANVGLATSGVALEGDCDSDGRVTISEVQGAINMFLGLANVATCADRDGNGQVSVSEIQKTINRHLYVKRVVPQNVELKLVTTKPANGSRVAALDLSAVAAAYITDGSASDLDVVPNYSPNKLNLGILGYNFTPHTCQPGEVKLPAVLYSRTRVALDSDWLGTPAPKEIVFSLGSESYAFSLLFSNYLLRLSPVDTAATDAIQLQPKYGSSDTSSSISVVVWPDDVAVLYLAGYMDTNADYGAYMRQFAQAAGYLPADEVYSGLPQPVKNVLYVVTGQAASPGEKVQQLGSLSQYPGIQVYLRKVNGDFD